MCGIRVARFPPEAQTRRWLRLWLIRVSALQFHNGGGRKKSFEAVHQSLEGVSPRVITRGGRNGRRGGSRLVHLAEPLAPYSRKHVYHEQIMRTRQFSYLAVSCTSFFLFFFYFDRINKPNCRFTRRRGKVSIAADR